RQSPHARPDVGRHGRTLVVGVVRQNGLVILILDIAAIREPAPIPRAERTAHHAALLDVDNAPRRLSFARTRPPLRSCCALFNALAVVELLRPFAIEDAPSVVPMNAESGEAV